MRYLLWLVLLVAPALAQPAINTCIAPCLVLPPGGFPGTPPGGGTSPPSGGDIVIGAVASVTSCTAPCPVFFDYTATTAPETQFPFHELHYRTNFGDDATDTYQFGATNSTLTCGSGDPAALCNFMAPLSKNTGLGPVVGHVYGSAGTYTPEVTVTGAHGPVTQALPPITVTHPAITYGGIWDGRICRFSAPAIGCTACVGAVLDDCEAGNRDPKGAGSDLAAIVAAYLTASNRVLFHATERFPAGSTVATLACSDCQIGGFGVGAKPIIAAAAVRTASPVLNVGARMVNVSVHDVEIDAGNVGISCMGMGQGARRVMMLNSTCQGGGGVIGATTPVDNSAAVDEVYINSVSWHGMGAGPCGQEVVYFRGISRLSMLGNDFEGADQTSQSMTRLQSWQKVELGRSYYSRPCAERASIDIRGDVSLQAGAGKVTVDRYANIWQNIHVGNTRSGGGGPGMAVQPQSDATGAPNHYPDGPVEDVLLDGNACWFGITSQQCLGVSSASRVTIRNMVVNAVNRQPGDTVPAVSLSWTRRPEHPQPDHVWAYNNVYDCGVVVGSGNAMFRFQAPYVPGGAKFQNNLQFCATALAAPIYANSTPSSAPVVAGNSDEIDANPMWANGSGSFTLHSDYAVGNPVFKSGVTVPVYFDIAGRPVARTAPMIGAVQ